MLQELLLLHEIASGTSMARSHRIGVSLLARIAVIVAVDEALALNVEHNILVLVDNTLPHMGQGHVLYLLTLNLLPRNIIEVFSY